MKSSKFVRGLYVALGTLNAGLLVAVQSNAFASAPQVAHYVALASFVAAAMLHQFAAETGQTAAQLPLGGVK